jgi:alanine racemase
MIDLTWVEIDKNALSENIKTLRKIVGDETVLCPCVKGNAYGHGLILSSKVFLENGADWLGVNSLYEARKLREAGIKAPIYVLGYLGFDELEEAISMDLRIVIYNEETVLKLKEILKGRTFNVHIKVETGNNRQGVKISEILDFAKLCIDSGLTIEGLSTHFANIEDSTDHSFAFKQFDVFNEAINLLERNGITIKYKHSANSAGTLLFDEVKMNMVRPGIACYGMWPSNETFISSREKNRLTTLKRALTWKSKIAQIKNVDENEFIGYGLTYKTTRSSKIAIIPIGYYDGYDRGLNSPYVLINGKRAFVRGRICMNIIMVDVSDIPEAKIEDEVVLIGKSGDENISAELFAKWAGTINYEVTTRINERIARILL